MERQVLRVDTQDLYTFSDPYFATMCGLNRASKMAEKIKAKSEAVRDMIFVDTTVDFILTPLEPSVLGETAIQLGADRVECTVFDRIPKETVTGIVAFAMHAPMPDLSKLPISDVYLADTWQTAFVDAGRDYIRHQVADQMPGTYVTDAIGPGFYGMECDSVDSLYQVVKPQDIDIQLMPSGMMNPVKSIIGFFLVLTDPASLPPTDCFNCVGAKSSCRMCKNYGKTRAEVAAL